MVVFDSRTPENISISSVASVSVSEQATQTITFNALPDRVAGATFTLAATATSGLPVTFTVAEGPATLGTDGKTVTVGSTAGTVKIRASQSGGTRNSITYAAADPVEQSFEVTLGPPTQTQTITFSQPAALTYGDAPFDLVATANSGLPVFFQLVSTVPSAGVAMLDDGTLTITGVGKVTVRATQPGAYPFKPAAAVTRTITVNKAPLAVSFDSVSRLVRTASPVFVPHYTGFVNGDTVADLASTRPVGKTAATLASPEGQYRITFTGGFDANYRFVAGEPAFLTVLGFSGSYEALLVDVSGTARGKLELLVPNNALTYTGTLNLASEPAAIAIRGNLAATDGSSATATWTRAANPAKAVAALSLGFEITGDTLDVEISRDGEPFLGIATGSRLFVQPVVAGKKQNAPWLGLHTLVLHDPAPLDPAPGSFPLGAGHASASIAATGAMTLKGKLADGLPLTTTAKADASGRYRLYARPYAKRLDSFLSGEFVLQSHPDEVRFPHRYHLPETDGVFTWSKAALPESTKPASRDKSYRAGFAVDLAAALDPWLPPAKATAVTQAITLPERLALLAAGSGTDAPFALTFSGDFLTEAELQSLPASLTLRANGTIPPRSPNPRSFLLSVNSATGALTGSFSLSDQVNPPPARPVTRKVTVSGTLRQGSDGSADTLGHAHLLFDPIPGDTGPAANELISAELQLMRP